MSSEKNIYVDVWLISQLTARLVADLMADSRLSLDEFAIYGLIADLGPLTSSDLVRATGMSPTTVSGLIRRCVKRGELEQAASPEDSRSKLLSLTPRGVEVYTEVVPALLYGLEELGDHLGERHRLVRLALQELDGALRHLSGVGPRPYSLDEGTTPTPTLAYSGPPLNPRQRREVLRYVDWIRNRDSQPDTG